MAQRKRTREDDDVDGDTEVEIESASSSFRQNLNKRTKVALARERGGSVVSDDDDYQIDDYDDLLNEEEERGPSHDPDAEATLYISDESDADSSVEEIAATQIVEKQLRQLRDNIASDEGIIEEVTARNFMCHSNMRIKFGPLINFIIGHNGSGKSAVLTALTMCLGGKANQTNRGANLKSMIKTGQETATLGVKIKNQGENAYKHDLYGDSVTVERHFSRSGTSGFKIKNDQNKTITTKRADLDDILDYFSLQLDNPINVLTQDMARSFLSNSSASDKYKFFLKGTQLETLDADYKLFEMQLDSMNEKLRVREGDIELLAQKERDALQRKKRADRSKAIDQKIREVQRMHAWLQVQGQEEVVQECENKVEAGRDDVREEAEKAEEIAAAFEGHEQAVQAATRRIEEFQAQLGPAKEKRDAEKAKFDKNKAELLKVTTDERGIHDSLKKNKKEVQRLGTEIGVEKERLSDAHGDAHTKRLEELEDLKATAEAAKQAREEHAATLPALESDSTDLLKRCQAAKNASENAKAAARDVNGRLQQLQREDGQWHAPYHPKMRALIQEIDRETRWRAKPVGPMGTKVHLNKPEWGSIIEKTFGGSLDGFAVTCKDDQEFLSKIAKRVGINIQIFISNPRPIDTTGNEPEERVDTILRVLKIDDDLVRNILIVNQAIEQIVLIPDSREARDYMHQHPRPANCRATIGFGANRDSGVRYELSRVGAQKSSPVQPWGGPRRMRSNRDQQLAHERKNLEDARSEAEKAEQKTRALQTELTKAQQAVARHKRDQQNLKTKMQQDEDAVDAKQAEIDSTRPQDGRLQELERLLEQAKSDVENDKSQYQDTVLEKEKLGSLGAELKSALDAVEAEWANATRRVERAEAQLKDVQDTRHAALLEKNAAFDNVKTAEGTVAKLEEKRDAEKAKLDDWTGQAASICERVPIEPGATIDALDKRLTKFKQQRDEEAARAGGSREDLTALHKAADDEWRKAKNERDTLVKIAKVNSPGYTAKSKLSLESVQRNISLRARITFQYLLSERRYRGRVILNHSDKTLDISVEPDITKVSDSGRQAKTLSGGEKSFSTICLLLSIWEAMGSPIRCLDEFDVFMDSVNRAQSMQMMIQTARRSVGRQFILITPQAMNNVTLGDDVKIHKMSDPERGIAAHFTS